MTIGQGRRKPIFGVLGEHFVCVGGRVDTELANYFLKIKASKRRSALQVNLEDRTSTEGGEYLLEFLRIYNGRERRQGRRNALVLDENDSNCIEGDSLAEFQSVNAELLCS